MITDFEPFLRFPACYLLFVILEIWELLSNFNLRVWMMMRWNDE